MDPEGRPTEAVALAGASEARTLQAQHLEGVGRLVEGISHEFNNVVNPVVGLTDLLLRDLDELDPRRPAVLMIKEAGEQATALTARLGAIAQKPMLDPVILDLNAQIGAIEPMLRSLVGDQIRLTARLAADLGQLRADPSQLERLMLDLVLNAREAMPDGGSLEITTRNADIDPDELVGQRVGVVRQGRYVVLAVSDTGTGMADTTKSRMFEPFFTTRMAEYGSGLGLFTVYCSVVRAEGWIQVTSELGQGTTVDVYLPET
jgi:two-component system cell cycle sensor histidine kinase/response regulator CckA